MMATQDSKSPVEGTIEEPPIEIDMDIADAGKAVGMVGALMGEATRVFFMAASEQWEHNKNWKWLRSETLKALSTPGD